MRTISIVLAGVIIVVFAVGCSSAESAKAQNQPASASSVAGRLLYSTGQPAGYIPVILGGLDEGMSDRRVTTDAKGNFSITGLKDGRYRFFEIRIYVDGGKGRCEVLDRLELRIHGAAVQLGELMLVRKTIMPIAG